MGVYNALQAVTIGKQRIFMIKGTMKKMILTQHQAQLVLKNIPYKKSITGSDRDLQRILSSKPIKPNKKKVLNSTTLPLNPLFNKPANTVFLL